MDLTGKYNERSESIGFFAGDRDMFAYLVDESSWTHYWGERFATAFVVYNSEVGGRSVGIQSGWYHSGSKGFMLNGDSCPIRFSRRHSIRVQDALEKIRDRIHVWQNVAEDQSDLLMKQLAEARQEMFAKSNASMQKKLIAYGICTEHAKAIDKWLVTEGRSFSRLDVAIAISAVSSSLPFASTGFELGQVSGKLLQSFVSESSSLPLQQA